MKNHNAKAGRRLTALLLSAALTAGSAAPAFAEGEIGNGVYATYDEAYYVNLDYYGNLQDASVVKSYILNGVDRITDYGDYDSINNLTDGTAPAEENGAHVFRFGEDAPNHFYFEGKTDKPFGELPWTISVSYKLNGVPVKAEDLAGKTGMVEIAVDAVPCEKASEYARNNYTLEVMGLFNQDNILSMNAPGAQVQLIGNLRAVLFLGLPGEEEHFVIQVGAEDFAFDGLTILMVPANLGALDQISDLSEKKDELEDDYEKLDGSIDTLLDSFSGMSASLRETADGLDELNGARGVISGEKNGLYDQADEVLGDVDGLRGDIDTASANAEDLKKDADDAAANLDALNGSLTKSSEGLDKLAKALDDVEQDLSVLRDYTDGSGSDAKAALKKLSTDTAALRDSLSGLTETLALLDVQVGGKDVTVQGTPTQELDAAQKQAQALLALYKEAEAIAPLNSADMFKAAANAASQGISVQESLAQLQAQQEQLTQAVTAVIMGSQGAIPDEASALAYIQANAASDPSFAAIAAALQQSALMDAIYAAAATGENGQMTEEDFLTALAMAQAGTAEGASAYRASVRSNLELMNAMEDGLIAQLAGLCDSLSKGSAAAAKALGSTSTDLAKETKDTADDLETLADRASSVLTQTATLLKSAEALTAQAEEAVPDLKDCLTDAQALLTHLSETAGDTSTLLRNFEGVMKRAGVLLDDGTRKTLEGLASTLRELADSTDATSDVRSAKDSVSGIVEDVWNDYTGQLNNLLLMDPSAPPQSLTDSRNDTPTSIQVLIRTQEIKVQEVEEAEPQEEEPEAVSVEKPSLWSRIVSLLAGIRSDVAGWLGHKGEEEAEL